MIVAGKRQDQNAKRRKLDLHYQYLYWSSGPASLAGATFVSYGLLELSVGRVFKNLRNRKEDNHPSAYKADTNSWRALPPLTECGVVRLLCATLTSIGIGSQDYIV